MAEVDVYNKIREGDRKVYHVVNLQEPTQTEEHACADPTHTCKAPKQFVVVTLRSCANGPDTKLATLARVDSDGEKKASELLATQQRNHKAFVQHLHKIAESEGWSRRCLAEKIHLKVKDLRRIESAPKMRAWLKKYQNEQRRKGLSAPIANKVASKPEPKPKKAPASRMTGNAKMTPQQRKFYNRLPRSSASATAFLEASSEERNKMMAVHRK